MAGLKNILIVEDDAMIRELYRSTLDNAKYKVVTAGSATELYAKLTDGYRPDCILLDIMLPEVSGLEILHELRKNAKYGCTNTKIAVMTNLAEKSIKDKAVENGADAYVIKSEILPHDLPGIISSLE